MDHLTNDQKKEFITKEFSTVAEGRQTLGRNTTGTYSCNHNKQTISFLLELLLGKVGFDQNDPQLTDLLDDADMICT
jgi:hypothetical protein